MHWLPIETAPVWVNNSHEALLGQRNSEGRWVKISAWEPSWSRDSAHTSGATHWCRIAPPPMPEDDDAFRALQAAAGCPLSGV